MTIAGSASTQSRSTRPGKPVILSHCSGAYEYTVDGREILSWPMGQFGGLLGYPSYDNFLTRPLVQRLLWNIEKGHASLGSYAPESEYRLAEKLITRFAPYMNSESLSTRFFSNGTDSTQCAIALARHITGKSKIVSIGYHGGSSPVFAFAPQNSGVLKQNSLVRADVNFCDYFEFRQHYDFEGVAAIIVEVPSTRTDEEVMRTLQAIDWDCREYGCKLIMDEIVTGFRMAPAGAIEYYSQQDFSEGNLTADYICLGKALSTYGKVSALIADSDDMSELTSSVFASYTYNDHPLGFIDALLTLEAYDSHPDLYSHINTIGTLLSDGLNHAFSLRGFPAEVYGHPSRTALEFHCKPEVANELLGRVVDEENVLLHRPQFSTLAHHSSDVDKTIHAVNNVLHRMGYELQ